MPKFSISILALNNLELTKRCVASVMRHSDDYELILTNNGSSDGIPAFFDQLAKEFSNVTVQHNEINLGYQEPNRIALERARGTYLVLLNNDCEVPAQWLTELEKPFSLFPKACITAPKECASALHPNFNGYRSAKVFEYTEFSTAMLKVDIFRKEGLWIDGIKHSYADDSSTCLRMRELGYTLHLVPIHVLHHGGRTSKFVPDIRKIQEENHAFCRKRFGHYLRFRRFDFPIVVRRTGAFGDVLLTTPIIQQLKERFPLSPIHVETVCTQIFLRNPHVASAAVRLPKMPDALVFDLNGSYEAKPNQHFVRTYAQKCGLDEGHDRTQLYLSDSELNKADAAMLGENWIAVHSGPSTWRSKEWPLDRFQEVISALRAEGKRVVLVGSAGKPLACDLDKRGVTSIHEMAAFIKRAELFIGLDSLPMHVSQAVGTPTIGLFGVTDPQWIMTSGSRHKGVCGTTDSFGLRHRKPGTTMVDDGGAAMNSISTAMVLEAAHEMLAKEVVAV